MDGPVELTRGERVDRVLSGKEPHLRPGDPPPVPQELEELRREHRKAIPSPLALLDPEQHALGINVADLERYDLGHAQARAIGGAQGSLVLRAQAPPPRPTPPPRGSTRRGSCAARRRTSAVW